MRRGGALPYLLIAPSVLFLAVLFLVPLVQTAALAFQANGGWSADNFARMADDINFPDDPFISGRHAELRITNGVLSVTDLGSRNGTFVRVQSERVLKHGDYVFLGQQLLRVEIV